MIPEAAYGITSVTLKRNREFQTPLGRFTYQHLHPSKYPVGVSLVQANRAQAFLIATPEKALADLVAPVVEITTPQLMESYLVDHLRVDPDSIPHLSEERLTEIARVYQNRRVSQLLALRRKR
ncbi:MAG: hypothetical protein AB7F31_06575 [Parachlamydiales bacterium]